MSELPLQPIFKGLQQGVLHLHTAQIHQRQGFQKLKIYIISHITEWQMAGTSMYQIPAP